MNLEVFCYIGLLRYPEQLEASIALLPEQQKAEAAAWVQNLKSQPRAEVLRRWSRLREQEYAAALREAREQSGMRVDELPPSLRPWIMAQLADHHG